MLSFGENKFMLNVNLFAKLRMPLFLFWNFGVSLQICVVHFNPHAKYLNIQWLPFIVYGLNVSPDNTTFIPVNDVRVIFSTNKRRSQERKKTGG